ncbi:hypothetical protein NC653_010078 [Populus alba x Populus x berolinensis]|uniref:Uncharacterized protein n=1 Tax=Populus alba x Populus x berolinensis TaxID=444605 RepID=A0AAD6QYY5_9ROSI|nr:hypothetical protein NC653_010078 [Populus alba x Populus x berolinensis]
MIMWVSRGTVVGPEVTIGHSTKDRDRGFRVVVSPWSYAWYWGFLWMTMVAQHDEERASTAECYHMEIIVEIGANCTLHGDRDRETKLLGIIPKLDNLVQIGHNVVIGRGCACFVDRLWIAGSQMTMGGLRHFRWRLGCAVRDHVSIASKEEKDWNARLAALWCSKHIKAISKKRTKEDDY